MHDHECDVAVDRRRLWPAPRRLSRSPARDVRCGCSSGATSRAIPNRGDILHAPTVEVVRQQLGILGLLEDRGAGRLHGLDFEDSAGGLFAGSEIRESWLLNHAEMEAVFLEAAEKAGVVIQPDRVRSLERDNGAGGGWLLVTDNGVTSARLVVGGDGAESLTRKTLDIPLEDVHEYENWIVVLHSPTPSWLKPDYGWTLLHPEGTVWMLPTTPVGRPPGRAHRAPGRGQRLDGLERGTSSASVSSGATRPCVSWNSTSVAGSHVYRIKRQHAASYSGPRAALTGDAVHTTHPAGGQGLNIAIQDSAKLAELVGPVLLDAGASEQAFTDALAEYEAIRRPINTATLQVAHMCSLIAGPGQRGVRAGGRVLQQGGVRSGLGVGVHGEFRRPDKLTWNLQAGSSDRLQPNRRNQPLRTSGRVQEDTPP